MDLNALLPGLISLQLVDDRIVTPNPPNVQLIRLDHKWPSSLLSLRLKSLALHFIYPEHLAQLPPNLTTFKFDVTCLRQDHQTTDPIVLPPLPDSITALTLALDRNLNGACPWELDCGTLPLALRTLRLNFTHSTQLFIDWTQVSRLKHLEVIKNPNLILSAPEAIQIIRDLPDTFKQLDVRIGRLNAPDEDVASIVIPKLARIRSQVTWDDIILHQKLSLPQLRTLTVLSKLEEHSSTPKHITDLTIAGGSLTPNERLQTLNWSTPGMPYPLTLTAPLPSTLVKVNLSTSLPLEFALIEELPSSLETLIGNMSNKVWQSLMDLLNGTTTSNHLTNLTALENNANQQVSLGSLSPCPSQLKSLKITLRPLSSPSIHPNTLAALKSSNITTLKLNLTTSSRKDQMTPTLQLLNHLPKNLKHLRLRSPCTASTHWPVVLPQRLAYLKISKFTGPSGLVETFVPENKAAPPTFILPEGLRRLVMYWPKSETGLPALPPHLSSVNYVMDFSGDIARTHYASLPTPTGLEGAYVVR